MGLLRWSIPRWAKSGAALAPLSRAAGEGLGERAGIRKSEAHHVEQSPALSPGPSPISSEKRKPKHSKIQHPGYFVQIR
ncbi:hypothetical protein CS8_007040 [Cupriavidus sp. 8B]